MATSCNKAAVGRTLLAFWAEGTCTDDPKSTAVAPLTYSPLGGVQTISENKNYREVTSNTDASNYTETNMTGMDREISISCLHYKDLATKSSQQALRLIADKAEQGLTEVVWLMLVDEQLNERRYYFVTPKNPTNSSELEGNRTAEFSFITQPTYEPTNATVQREDGTGL